MAGDDPAGGAFGRSYNKSASKLLEAMATTRNGLCCLGYRVRMSAHNYSVAEAMSNVSGHSQPLPVPHLTAAISVGSAPSAVGTGVGAPAGWGWVAKYIGMIWPTGDSAKLRAAAAAWTSAGTNFEVSEITGAVGPIGTIGAQQIPEAPAIGAAFTDADRSAAGILQQCATIATQLTSMAAKIDAVHAAILDLLSRICDPLTGLKEVWDILTGEDEDEIRKIANDIRTIVNQFTAEVDALRQQIATALTESTTILSTMGRYAEKEWDHFLHGTDVGRALDHVGQIGGGVLTEAGGVIQGFWNLNPVRAFVDPDGFWHSVDGTLDHLESLAGLDGEQSFKEAWKDLGKDVVHWDEWSQNPFKAAGESAFDLATLAVPGGALSKLPKLGRVAADAAERSEEFHPPAPLRESAPSHDAPAPRNERPRGGQPAPAPKSKGPMPPCGLTESKNPVGQKLAADNGSKPVAEPATSAAHAPSSTPAAATLGAAGTQSAPLPLSPVTGQPHGGAPSTYSPHSPVNNHHGPVAHADDYVAAGPLTSGDLSALADYTGLGHEDLNDALRTNSMDASQQARVEALNQALEKLPPHVGPVVRGTDLPPNVLAQYQPDAVVTERAFLSTSLEPAVAQSTAFSGNVEFRILSRTGRDISSFSTFPSEREVLFPNGAQFYVVDRKLDPLTGRAIIEMIER